MAPAHLNNRFSAIQSTAHNFHWRCAHDVCLLRTNERIAPDVFACDSTFSDIAEWTISVQEKTEREFSKLKQIYKIAVANDYDRITGISFGKML